MEGEHGAVEGPEVSVGVRVLVESSARPPTGGSTDCITAWRYGAVTHPDLRSFFMSVPGVRKHYRTQLWAKFIIPWHARMHVKDEILDVSHTPAPRRAAAVSLRLPYPRTPTLLQQQLFHFNPRTLVHTRCFIRIQSLRHELAHDSAAVPASLQLQWDKGELPVVFFCLVLASCFYDRPFRS